MSLTILDRLVREAKPTARNPQRNLICADLDHCMMPAVQSVGGCIREQEAQKSKVRS